MLQLKKHVQIPDAIGETTLLVVFIVFAFMAYKLWRANEQGRPWMGLFFGIVAFSVGSFLDLMDEFVKFPAAVPHGIEKPLQAIGAVLIAASAWSILSTIIRSSRKDADTGARNRRHFVETLVKQISRSEQDGSEFALLFLDMGQWGEVTMPLLQQMARALMDGTRSTDTVARWGETIFAILVPSGNAKGMFILRDRVLESLGQSTSRTFRTDCGSGFAMYPLDGTTLESLLDAIDKRLYHSEQTLNCEEGEGSVR
jgi:diguanylate cyclase (GGDEF)-like protein